MREICRLNHTQQESITSPPNQENHCSSHISDLSKEPCICKALLHLERPPLSETEKIAELLKLDLFKKKIRKKVPVTDLPLFLDEQIAQILKIMNHSIQ